MRIYSGGTYTNSYSSNALAPTNNVIAPSSNSYRSNTLAPSNNKRSFGPSKVSSFPSTTKGKSRIQTQDVENSENYENSNAPVVNNRPSTAPSLQKGLSYRTLTPTQTLGEPIEGGGCHLVYDTDSSGRLVEHYSKTELQQMAVVGRWTAGPGKKIAGFKFKRNAGRQVLIGSCSAGVQGRKNYCNGFCQFVKQAKLMNGGVTVYAVPTGFKAMPVDVYLYYDDNRPGHQIVKLEHGKSYTTEKVLAVGCLPKNTPFYESIETVDLLKWLHDAEVQGYSSKC